MSQSAASYAETKRDIITLLKLELGIIEAGGLGRSPREPWKPKSVFQYSVSCINHWVDPNHPPDTCEGCLLLQFVPDEHLHERVPCHHIPLNSAGETVESLVRRSDQEELEEALERWLKATIRRLEDEQARETPR